MLLTTIIFNGLLVLPFVLAYFNLLKVSNMALVKLTFIVGPIMFIGNKWAIPAFYTPLTLEQYRETKRQRIEYWMNHFGERTLSKISHLPTDREECQIYIHRKAFDVIKVGATNEFEGFSNICVFSEVDAAALTWQIERSTHEDIFVLGHGVLDSEGKETFANGFHYSTFEALANETGKRITILSCRGTREDGRKSFHLRWIEKDMDAYEAHKDRTMLESFSPHREGNLWVYGKHGFTVAADLGKQLNGWREVMKNN